MKKRIVSFISAVLICNLMVAGGLMAQEVKASKSKKLSLSGRVQLQHAWNEALSLIDAPKTKHGFRIRRGRLQVKAQINPYVSAKLQVEARDNAPRLKDAEGKIKFFRHYYFRFGQFKVPVWREEFRRSSGSLLLVERSPASKFLIVNLLAARQIGLEFGGKIGEKIVVIVNYNNGSGEGNSELEGSKTKSVNNGKMVVGRIDLNLSNVFKFGLSGAVNNVGTRTDTLNTAGNNTLIAPDFGIYLPAGIDIEGGIAFGEISKGFIEEFEDKKYTVWDVSGRWKTRFDQLEEWGGLSGVEVAAGISSINSDASSNDGTLFLKVGPGIYFGKNARLQSNL
ncbi:MAG: porin, partial [Calditrichia bacterium]